MKKYVTLLSLCMVLPLATACGSSNPPDDTTIDSTTTTVTTETPQDTSTSTSQGDTETTQVESPTDLDLNAMVDAITSQVEWPSMAQIEDSSIVSEFFTLDTENPNYKQLLIMQCPMSAVISEIILIEAEDVDSAMEDLNARREKLINVDAYYPEHKEIAEQSIVGSSGNLVYFIANEYAEDSEKILLDYLNGTTDS